MTSVAPVLRARSSAPDAVEGDDRPDDLATAPAIMPSPIGPQPATTTKSPNVRRARSTAERARERLGRRRRGGRRVQRRRGDAGLTGEHHVLGHRPVHLALEAVDRVWFAHPAGAVAAEAAVTARTICSATTRSPTATPHRRAASSSSSTISPTNSCPGTTPGSTAGLRVAPELGRRGSTSGRWQTPTASTRTSASPGPGSGRRSSRGGSRGPWHTTAAI